MRSRGQTSLHCMLRNVAPPQLWEFHSTVVSLTLGTQRVVTPTWHLAADTKGTSSVHPQHAHLRPNTRGDAHFHCTAVGVRKTLLVFFRQPILVPQLSHHVLQPCSLRAPPLWLRLVMSTPNLAQLEHNFAALIVARLVFMACGMSSTSGGAAGATRWRCETFFRVGRVQGGFHSRDRRLAGHHSTCLETGIKRGHACAFRCCMSL